MKCRIPTGLAFLVLSAASLWGVERPNIIVMLMDDLGVNDIGAYTYPDTASPGPPPAAAPADGMSNLALPNHAWDVGTGSSLTPRIDSLATDGLRFTRFMATHSVCTPTRASLMTGSYATRVGLAAVVGPYPSSVGNAGLNSIEVTLPELLRTRGYATGMSGKWHLGHKADFNPLRHGFEHYFGILYSNDMWTANPYSTISWPDLDLMENEAPLGSYTTDTGYTISGPINTDAEQAVLLEAMTEQAVGMIDDAVDEGRPFFLYYAPHTPHVPVHPHPDFLSTAGQTDDRVRYDDLLEEVDARVGAILDRLAFHGIEDETIVLFSSDNGPWQSRPGSGNLEQGAGSAYPFRGRKNSTWEGGHRVPFMVRFPGTIPNGEVRDQLGTTADLYTTLAALAGATLPAYGGIDGVDLMPLFTGSDLSEPREAFYYYDASQDSAEAVIDLTTTDTWKAVSGSTDPAHNGLFRIGSGFTGDFQELSNVSGSFSSINTALVAQLNSWNTAITRRQSGTARSIAIEVENDAVTVDENGTATTRIRLSGSSTRTIHVGRYAGDSSLEVVSGSTLNFTPANWNQWQTVTFRFDPDLDVTDGAALFRAYGDSISSSSDIHIREIFVFENDTMVAVTQLPPPDNPLLLRYRLDETDGLLAEDASENNNDGTISNMSAASWESGYIRGGLVFDGSGMASVDTSAAVSAIDSTGLSATAWVRMDAPANTENRWILQQLDGTGPGRTWLAVDPGGQLYSYVGFAATAGGSVQTGNWQHIAVTAGNGEVRLYVDGSLVASSALAIEANDARFRIANHKFLDTGLQWIGGIDDVRLYAGVLSEDEVLWLASLTAPSMQVTPVLVNLDGINYIGLTYQQLAGGSGTTGVNYTIDGRTYTVETNDSLSSSWISGANLFESVGVPVPIDSMREVATVRLSDAVPPDGKQFLRLRVD
jgi:arylsulfatase A-like enzyme